MVDKISPEKRSQNMSKIRGSDTKPELLVRKYLYSIGFRYRLHDKRLPGRPDLVLRKHKAIIFVHGCFWHRHEGCPLAYVPKSRPDFWQQKFESNIERDSRQVAELAAMGWRVLIVWECALRGAKKEASLKAVRTWLNSSDSYAEIGANDTVSAEA